MSRQKYLSGIITDHRHSESRQAQLTIQSSRLSCVTTDQRELTPDPAFLCSLNQQLRRLLDYDGAGLGCANKKSPAVVRRAFVTNS